MNYMAVADYLQQPLSNLQNNYNITDFAFPYPFESLPLPLTSIEQQYHTFITNALYFALPNFRAQIDDFSSNEALVLIDGSTPMIAIYTLIIVMTVISMAFLSILTCRITRFNNKSKEALELI
jgi:hypothetical protein